MTIVEFSNDNGLQDWKTEHQAVIKRTLRPAKLVPVCRGPGEESMLNYTRRATSYVLIDGFL
ncbi:MAG: hypothetical protein WDZ47_15060 [Bacteroidales bacterium]